MPTRILQAAGDYDYNGGDVEVVHGGSMSMQGFHGTQCYSLSGKAGIDAIGPGTTTKLQAGFWSKHTGLAGAGSAMVCALGAAEVTGAPSLWWSGTDLSIRIGESGDDHFLDPSLSEHFEDTDSWTHIGFAEFHSTGTDGWVAVYVQGTLAALFEGQTGAGTTVSESLYIGDQSAGGPGWNSLLIDDIYMDDISDQTDPTPLPLLHFVPQFNWSTLAGTWTGSDGDSVNNHEMLDERRFDEYVQTPVGVSTNDTYEDGYKLANYTEGGFAESVRAVIVSPVAKYLEANGAGTFEFGVGDGSGAGITWDDLSADLSSAEQWWPVRYESKPGGGFVATWADLLDFSFWIRSAGTQWQDYDTVYAEITPPSITSQSGTSITYELPASIQDGDMVIVTLAIPDTSLAGGITWFTGGTNVNGALGFYSNEFMQIAARIWTTGSGTSFTVDADAQSVHVYRGLAPSDGNTVSSSNTNSSTPSPDEFYAQHTVGSPKTGPGFHYSVHKIIHKVTEPISADQIDSFEPLGGTALWQIATGSGDDGYLTAHRKDFTLFSDSTQLLIGTLTDSYDGDPDISYPTVVTHRNVLVIFTTAEDHPSYEPPTMTSDAVIVPQLAVYAEVEIEVAPEETGNLDYPFPDFPDINIDHGNEIVDCTAIANGQEGIYLLDIDDSILQDNRVQDNGRSAANTYDQIRLENSDDNFITGNKAFLSDDGISTPRYGLYLGATTNSNRVHNNDLTSSGGSGDLQDDGTNDVIPDEGTGGEITVVDGGPF